MADDADALDTAIGVVEALDNLDDGSSAVLGFDISSDGYQFAVDTGHYVHVIQHLSTPPI